MSEFEMYSEKKYAFLPDRNLASEHYHIGYPAIGVADDRGFIFSPESSLERFNDLYFVRKAWMRFGFPKTRHLLESLGHVYKDAEPDTRTVWRLARRDATLSLSQFRLGAYITGTDWEMVDDYDRWLMGRKPWKFCSQNTFKAFIHSMGGRV